MSRDCGGFLEILVVFWGFLRVSGDSGDGDGKGDGDGDVDDVGWANGRST